MTGSGRLLRFMLRRERIALPVWLLGAALLVLVQSTQSQNLYETPEDLANLRRTLGGNTAVIAMSGPVRLLETIGGEVAFEILAFVSILVALMNMFLVGRHTRADEESGRAELVRSASVGRGAPLAAILGLALLANLAVAVLLFAVTAGTGLPVRGSFLFGAAVALVGLFFAALTAVAAQVFESVRAAYGAVALAIGAAFVLRAAGDAGDGTASWASPIGWAQRTFPYVDNRWWPLLIPTAVAGGLAVAAMALLARRDIGAGLVRPRPGRAHATASLRSPLALAWRLQRGALVGWTVGLFLLGAAYGSIGDSIEQYVADNPEVAEFLPGGAADLVDAFQALTMVTLALIASGYAVSAALRARSEETSGRAEPLLATATSRRAWLSSHLSVAAGGSALVLAAAGAGEGLAYGLTICDLGQLPRLVGVALAYLPAVLAIAAVAALGIGWLPRAAAVVAWTAVAYCAVIALFGDSFDLPAWVQRGSPFAHTPQAPVETLTALPIVAVAAVAAALALGGYVGLRRRDVGY
ncbi:ABC-2 type transport system permease protein [Asanoa hainanensis]|uniref:ABC-2 type transport system permease protein n=1 Tax=Asanoa hainanensis TaxID=560556 RepID=A0A239PF70_9ACTN|nr:ABC transporter permease [Asanoa hainanensis]SNT65515.1 ABC-2 type transport system permease protein [Asanoa hainanensis]